MTGKIIIHTSSLIFNPKSLLSGITRAFTYTITASLLPKAHVVKLFKPIKLDAGLSENLLNKNRDEIYYIADHKNSGQSVRTFLNKINFSPLDLSNHLRRNASIDLQAGENNPVVLLSTKKYIN